MIVTQRFVIWKNDEISFNWRNIDARETSSKTEYGEYGDYRVWRKCGNLCATLKRHV